MKRKRDVLAVAVSCVCVSLLQLTDEEEEDDRTQQSKTAIIACLAGIAAALEEDDDSRSVLADIRVFPKCRGFFKRIEGMDMDEYLSHFRINREASSRVVNLVAENTELTGGLTVPERCLIALWYLANPGGYRNLSQQFGVSMSTAHLCVHEVTRILCDHVRNFVRFPTSNEMPRIAAKFEKMYGFPGVIGCIDGTHIPIHPPAEHAADYINRKNVYSINVAAVCDSDLRFISLTVGYSGRCHDSRVYRESALFCVLQNIPSQYHLLGDAAYPISNYMLVPYPQTPNLTREAGIYNNRHSSTRMTVERSFGMLKAKWLKLNDLNCHIDNVPKIITACCILHNIYIDSNSSALAYIQRNPFNYGTGAKRDIIARVLALSSQLP